ncbi:MAG: GNAT family N-acetyltransferase [Chloroflexi bacterium]|nr:GNAT family N-acetyltransferase [Chloroflexota bacterium]
MDYSYKQVSSSETGLLRDLLVVFAEAFGEPQTYLAAVPGEGYLQALLGKRHFIALVALAGRETVGGLVAYELDKFEQERSEIYIYDLAVKKSHRRRGVATRLINALRGIARERKAWVIIVQADYGDTPAIRLYESLGKKENVYNFDIPV